MGLFPGLGRSPGIANGNTLQYSCLELHRQRSLWAIVYGVTKWDMTEHQHTQVRQKAYRRLELGNFTSSLLQHREASAEGFCFPLVG